MSDCQLPVGAPPRDAPERSHAVVLTAAPPAPREVLEALGANSASVHELRGPVEPAALSASLEAHLARQGTPVAVVNMLDAVAAPAEPAEALTDIRWQQTVDEMLTRTLTACQVLGRAMLAGDGGVIITVLSGVAGDLAAGVADRAATGLMRVLAVEWAPSGVRVVTISPSGRPGPDRDRAVAAAIAFLAGRDGSYVTGTEVCVDVARRDRATASRHGGADR